MKLLKCDIYEDRMCYETDGKYYNVDEVQYIIKELLSSTPDIHELVIKLSELFEVDI